MLGKGQFLVLLAFLKLFLEELLAALVVPK